MAYSFNSFELVHYSDIKIHVFEHFELFWDKNAKDYINDYY